MDLASSSPNPSDGAARAAFTSGVVRDASTRALLTVSGRDRLEFVNRMGTNDARRIAPDLGIATVLPTAKGRIVDLVRVGERGDDLLLLGSEGNGPRLKEWLEKFVVMEELTIADARAELGALELLGPGVASALRRVLGVAPEPRDDGLAMASTQFGGGRIDVSASGAAPLHAYALVAPVALLPRLTAELVSAGLSRIGDEAWERVRIEAGIPGFGRELSENVNPLEARLLAAVSFTKGCYIGQEVVARLSNYSKVQRLLVGLKFPPAVEPATLHEVFVDLLRIGHVSSATRSSRLDATLALAFVKTEYSQAGTKIHSVHGGEPLHGTIVDLPFV